MKLTKSQLKQLIKEEISQEFPPCEAEISGCRKLTREEEVYFKETEYLSNPNMPVPHNEVPEDLKPAEANWFIWRKWWATCDDIKNITCGGIGELTPSAPARTYQGTRNMYENKITYSMIEQLVRKELKLRG